MIKENENLMTLPVMICNRKAFGNAASEGKSVNELKIADRKAILEIDSLYKCIFG